EIIECHEQTEISFTYPYLVMNDVMKAVKSPEIRILSQEFDNTCRISLSIRSDHAPGLKSALSSISGLSILE
ncbi:MAG: YigZ family protein, partial [Muribaculaceae bacterium]|nr:YigZ family protein [Muribaculaceae bacterium]